MLNPLGPCDPPLYPYCNTLPTTPHPIPVATPPQQPLHTHTIKGTLVHLRGSGGGGALPLPKRVNHLDCQGQRHDVCCTHKEVCKHTHSHAHTKRQGASKWSKVCADMPKCNTHSRQPDHPTSGGLIHHWTRSWQQRMLDNATVRKSGYLTRR